MMPDKTTSWYIKTIIISLMLFLQTYILGMFMEQYIAKGNYLNITTGDMLVVKIVTTLLLILITYSLSIGGWGKWEQYVSIAIPISMAMALILIKYNAFNGITTTLLISILIGYNLYKTNKLKQLLTRFEPKVILGPSSRGLLLAYSIFAVLILMLNNNNKVSDINIGEKVANVTEKPLRGIPNVQYLNLDTTSIVENQVNSMLIPYKSFFKPVMAVLVFVIFKFLGSISYWIYTFLIGPIFHIARRSGLIRIKKVTVEQEIPMF